MSAQAIDAAFWLPVLSPVLSMITGLGAVAPTARAQRENERRRHFETMRMEAYSDLMRGIAAQLEQDVSPSMPKRCAVFDVEGMSVQGDAAEIGIEANNAGVRVHRAREALRKRVKASCGTCAEHGCLNCTCKMSCGTAGSGDR
jgi:hypothetical protein